MSPPAVVLEVLPAGFGDCLLVSCPVGRSTWRMLVDTGPDETYPTLRRRLLQIPKASDGKRDHLSRKSVWIAFPVKAFVMMPDGLLGTGQPGIAGDDLDAQYGVSLHDLKFFARQPSRFQQNLIRNTDFSNVVEKGAQHQFGNGFLVNAHRSALGNSVTAGGGR